MKGRRAAAAKAFDARGYWDQRLDRDWSLRGVGVSTVSYSYNRWLYRVRDRIFRRAVAMTDLAAVGKPRVLDVGPGVGFYVERWKRLGTQVSAVDIADSVVRRLSEAHPDVRVRRLDISDPVRDLEGNYDAVSAFDIFFHIVDDKRYRQAMRNVADLLRPGGWFIFTETLSSRRTQSHAHYMRRSRQETEAAVRAAGLEIVATRPAFVVMSFPFDASPAWRERWREWVAGRLRSEIGGNLMGGLLFLPELVLTAMLSDGPATELLVCRKPLIREQA